MIVIKDGYGCYLTRVWTAQPSDMVGKSKNHLFNFHFHADSEKKMCFDNMSDAQQVLAMIPKEFLAKIHETQKVIFNKAERRFLKSVEVRATFSSGKPVAKSVSKWTGDVSEALQFTDDVAMKAIFDLVERGENNNGNFGHITTVFV